MHPSQVVVEPRRVPVGSILALSFDHCRRRRRRRRIGHIAEQHPRHYRELPPKATQGSTKEAL